MKKFQDISLNEVGFKNEYYESFTNGNIDKALKFIFDNNLEDKVIQAEDLNMFASNITELEKRFFNFISSLDEKEKEYQTKIDNLNYLNEFNNSKQYDINNFVKYNKEVYFCYKTPPIGTLPTNNTYWLLIGLKGDEGAHSLGVNYKGEWNQSLTYKNLDMVNYKNNLYVCKGQNTNKKPDINLNEWSLQMQISNSKITAQKETPVNMNNDEIWFQIL